MKNPKAPEGKVFKIRQFESNNILENVKKMLVPVEELGYVINELAIKDARYIGGELERTLQQNLTIKLQKG